MTKKTNLFTATIVSFLCLFSVNAIHAQNKKAVAAPATTTPTPPVMPPKKEGIKAFAEVITAKAKSKSGLFKTHK